MSTRTMEFVEKEKMKNCQTKNDMMLVEISKNKGYCCFVVLAWTTYAASSPFKYLVLKLKSIEKESVVPVVQDIVKEQILSLLGHEFEISLSQATGPSTEEPMQSLTPQGASSMYEKVGELVGALHSSLACRAIQKYINNESVNSLVSDGLHIHRAHRVYHLKVTLSKNTLCIDATLLHCGLLNERILCAIMKYYIEQNP